MKSSLFNAFDTFLAQFFLEIAAFACFCSLGSGKLLTSPLSLYLRIEILMLPQSVSQFIAFSLKVYDIHLQTFFKLFSFCCSFRQIVTYFHQGEVTSIFFVFQKITNLLISFVTDALFVGQYVFLKTFFLGGHFLRFFFSSFRTIA